MLLLIVISLAAPDHLLNMELQVVPPVNSGVFGKLNIHFRGYLKYFLVLLLRYINVIIPKESMWIGWITMIPLNGVASTMPALPWYPSFNTPRMA